MPHRKYHKTCHCLQMLSSPNFLYIVLLILKGSLRGHSSPVCLENSEASDGAWAGGALVRVSLLMRGAEITGSGPQVQPSHRGSRHSSQRLETPMLSLAFLPLQIACAAIDCVKRRTRTHVLESLSKAYPASTLLPLWEVCGEV